MMIWEPLKRVGPLYFNSNIENVTNDATLVKTEDPDSNTNWSNYDYGPGIAEVYVDNGLITSVNCFVSCIYAGVELIGKVLGDFEKTLECKPSGPPEFIELPDGPQKVIEYDSVGAQVWVKEGLINTIIVTTYAD